MALLAVVVLAAGLNALEIGRTSAGIDFYQYWAAAEARRSLDASDLYAQAGRERLGAALLRRAQATPGAGRMLAAAEYRSVLETNQSPWLYAVLAPLNTGDYEADFNRYRYLCLLLTIGSVLALGRALGVAAVDALVVLLFALTAFEPLRSDLRVGNVSQLQLAMLTAWVWVQGHPPSRRRDLGGGALLGCCILFKPTLALVAAVPWISWLVAGEWRKLRDQSAGALLGAGACATAAALYFGSARVWLDFLAADPLRDDAIPFAEGNWAPASLLLDLSGWHLAPLLLGVLLALSGWLLWQRRAALRARPHADAAAAGLGCVVMLLSSPVAWVHYYVLALFPLLTALGLHGERSRGAAAVLMAGACVLPLVDSPASRAVLSAFPHLFAAAASLGVLGLGALILRGLKTSGSL